VQIGVPFTLVLLAFFIILFTKSAQKYRDDTFFLGITTLVLVLFLARQTEWGNTIEYFVTALFIALLLIPKDPKPQSLPPHLQYTFRAFLALWGILSVFAAMNYWQSDVAYDNATTEKISEERKTFQLSMAYQSMYWEPKYGLVYADRLAEIGEIEKAKEVLAYVQETHPKYGDVYFIAARIDWRTGQIQSANENFQKAVERAPARPVFWKEWGMFLQSQNLPGAEEKMRRYRELVE
jgi:tetratricopeptide (TPR) repeat protein